MNHFTAAQVYLPLAHAFEAAAYPKLDPMRVDEGPVETVLCSRFSVNDSTGAGGQRSAVLDSWRSPDAQAITAIPAEAWDPRNLELARQHGIVWVALADIHPSLTKQERVVAIVRRGATVLISMTLSATQQHIARDDGSGANAATWCVLSALNHFKTMQTLVFAEDMTRAARGEIGWVTLKEACLQRHVKLALGEKVYDLSNPGELLSLSVLSLFAVNDDFSRRAHLTGKRVEKASEGGAIVPDSGMPKGWRHARDEFGRVIKDPVRGIRPEADPKYIEVFPALFRPFLEGMSWQDLAGVLADLETRGLIRRKDHSDPGKTYQELRTPGQRHSAIGPFFARAKSRPPKPPSAESIQRYESGADPAEVFDWDVRHYLSRIELLRTGRYLRAINNDIKGILAKGVDGHVPVPRYDGDHLGAFRIDSEPWPWPVVDGKEVPRFGMNDTFLRRVGAEMLRRLTEESPAGGRPADDGLRRAIHSFSDWNVEDSATAQSGPSRWVMGAKARRNQSGRQTVRLMRKPADSPSGWVRSDGIATFALDELCDSAARELDRRVRQVIDPEHIATVTVVNARGRRLLDREAQRASINREIAALESELLGCTRLMAKAAGRDDEGEIQRLREVIADATNERDALRVRLDAIDAAAPDPQSERGEIGQFNQLAYVVAALERAAANYGRIPTAMAQQVDRALDDWRFELRYDGIAWRCTARLLTVAGRRASFELGGRVRNLSTSWEDNRAHVLGSVFGDGQPVDQVAAFIGTQRHALFARYLMPALIEHGITAMGAKCALVDHPLPLVRKAVWRLVNGQSTDDVLASPQYLELLRSTYLNPDLRWGQSAVPDDVRMVRRLIRLCEVEADHEAGVLVADLMEATGLASRDIRNFVVPRTRKAGFRRPRYLEYADAAKSRMRPVRCPHEDCDGYATHAVLLPEVAASGYAVICADCRRAPNLDGDWPSITFPRAYLGRFSANPEGGRISERQQSIEEE
ncbi:hypothetical protein K8Z61_14180 [Nocardioides sp. TRM66260-LWL]|uniref:hypothetical protein n=1 Tax=Nocardioides sp. TRM66260-LWL TaxID=2874478 RepID=UPI001CC7F326|nr:hypothetical protein [Nocardioides sp. TRM66260-LWL]MBZ5735639.1 hypothetical protein [Nocardioides sp. TRM66260-LWL]